MCVADSPGHWADTTDLATASLDFMLWLAEPAFSKALATHQYT